MASPPPENEVQAPAGVEGGESKEVAPFKTLQISASLLSIEVELFKVREGGREGGREGRGGERVGGEGGEGGREGGQEGGREGGRGREGKGREGVSVGKLGCPPPYY